MALPVWDSHNHLKGVPGLSASSFWDIGHYLWFVRELEGVGYPYRPMELGEDDRAREFVKAFRRGRNTVWARMLRSSLRELYDVDLLDEGGIAELNARIARSHADPDWPREVCERAGVRGVVVVDRKPEEFGGLADRVFAMSGRPYALPGESWYGEVAAAEGGRRAAVEAEAARMAEAFERFREAGRSRVVRVDWPFAGHETPHVVPDLGDSGNGREDIALYLAHALCGHLDERRFHLQVFLGVRSPTPGYRPRSQGHRHHSVEDPEAVSSMHDVFDMYGGCTFELITAAAGSSRDIVQAARAYRNVHPGGLWWFAFRPSAYREVMQHRLEALPAERSSLVVSDARCIEWLYVKVMLVKRLVADFLCERVKEGWLDGDTALHTARQWLHDAAEALYRPRAAGKGEAAGGSR